jgi:hypothetical protein
MKVADSCSGKCSVGGWNRPEMRERVVRERWNVVGALSGKRSAMSVVQALDGEEDRRLRYPAACLSFRENHP